MCISINNFYNIFTVLLLGSKTRGLPSVPNSRSDDNASVNGRNLKYWNPRRNGNRNYNLRQQRTDNLKRPAVVSNPETDIEILLETKPALDGASSPSALDGDEIEILSESPNIKQKPSKFERMNRKIAMIKAVVSRQNAAQTEQSAVTKQKVVKPKQYTALEVNDYLNFM